MTALFGTKYFGFIASSYAITTVVLILMVIWVLATHARRKRELRLLEEAGIRRASKADGSV